MMPATRNRMSGTSEYKRWHGMIKRTSDPANKDFKHYGARGISVCERWLDFSNFISDMGMCPPKLELDRIDNDGDYTPDNCRWASRTVQCRNTRANRLITFNGETLPMSAWAERLGIARTTIERRLNRGLPLHFVLSKGKRIDSRHAHVRAAINSNSVAGV
jgi:hypothetical protein